MSKKEKSGHITPEKRAAAKKTRVSSSSSKGPNVINASDWCRPPKPPTKPKK